MANLSYRAVAQHSIGSAPGALRLLGLALALTSYSESPFSFGKSCTDIGCLTFVRVELAFASELNSDSIQVVVEHDDQSFVCGTSAANPTALTARRRVARQALLCSSACSCPTSHVAHSELRA